MRFDRIVSILPLFLVLIVAPGCDFIWTPHDGDQNGHDRIDPPVLDAERVIAFYPFDGGARDDSGSDKWDDDTETPYSFSLQLPPARDRLWGAVYDRFDRYIADVPELWDGGWHHVAFSFELPNRQVRAFLDGDEVATTSLPEVLSVRNTEPGTSEPVPECIDISAARLMT